MDDLVIRARALWTALAGAPVTFRPGGVGVAVSTASRLCPPGWIGLVVIADAGIATVPDRGLVTAVAALPAPQATDPAFVRTALRTTAPPHTSAATTSPPPPHTSDAATSPPAPQSTGATPADRLATAVPDLPEMAEVLGPATLAYLEPAAFRPSAGHTVDRLPAGHPDLESLLAAATPEEVGEAGLADVESDVFVVREAGRVVTAAGYERWLGVAAHLCVLTAANARGRGLARMAASAAVTEALNEGLLPQWRAVPEPSRRVARALGFQELGSQLSVRPSS